MKLLLALLVFSIAWPIGARRVTRDVAELVVATGLQVAVLVLLAVFLPGWVWKTVLVLYLVFPRVVAPLIAWRVSREPSELRLVPFTGEAEGVSGETAASFAERVDEVRRGGFEFLGSWVERGPPVSIIRAMLEHPATHELASVILLVSEHTGPGGLLITRFMRAAADGRRLVVTDHPLPSVPGTRAVYLPTVNEPARQLAVLRALWARDHPGLPTTPVRRDGESAEAFLAREGRAALERGVTAGTHRRVDDASYGYTLRQALATSWVSMFPVAQIAELRARARERRLLRGLGLPDTPHGNAPPIQLDASAAMDTAALAIIAILLLPIPDRMPFTAAVRPARAADAELAVRPPAGFAVPADYPGAVRALEQLAGAPAKPMVLEDDEMGTSDTTQAFAVPVHTRHARPLLVAAAPLFRARGFMLFRHDQTFGIGNEPEELVLYPRYDPWAAMRAVGTNGANYGIETDSVVNWLAALHRDHPFTVVGIGYDEVEGVFDHELTPRQATEIARRLYDFCPDVVTQGTETVKALEREIRSDRILYCWWD